MDYLDALIFGFSVAVRTAEALAPHFNEDVLVAYIKNGERKIIKDSIEDGLDVSDLYFLKGLDDVVSYERGLDVQLSHLSINEDIDILYLKGLRLRNRIKITCVNMGTILILDDCTFISAGTSLFEQGKIVISRPRYEFSGRDFDKKKLVKVNFSRNDVVSLFLSDDKSRSFEENCHYGFRTDVENLFVYGDGSKSKVGNGYLNVQSTVKKLIVNDCNDIDFCGLKYGNINLLNCKNIYFGYEVEFDTLGAINSSIIGVVNFGTENSRMRTKDSILHKYFDCKICGENVRHFKNEKEEGWIGCNVKVENKPLRGKFIKRDKKSLLAELSMQNLSIANNYIQLLEPSLNSECTCEKGITCIENFLGKGYIQKQFKSLDVANGLVQWKNMGNDCYNLVISENMLVHLTNISFSGEKKVVITCPNTTTLILDNCTFAKDMSIIGGNVFVNSPKFEDSNSNSINGTVVFCKTSKVNLILNDIGKENHANYYIIDGENTELNVTGKATNSIIKTSKTSPMKAAYLDHTENLEFQASADEIVIDDSRISVGNSVDFSYLVISNSTVANVVALGAEDSKILLCSAGLCPAYNNEITVFGKTMQKYDVINEIFRRVSLNGEATGEVIGDGDFSFQNSEDRLVDIETESVIIDCVRVKKNVIEMLNQSFCCSVDTLLESRSHDLSNESFLQKIKKYK